MAPVEERVASEVQRQQRKFDDGEEERECASAAVCKSLDVAETEELIQFDKSLQELREIRSQLHYAADYCGSTFLNSEEKKPIVENTKEYICRAVVTMVDHLGNVSSNLTSLLSQASSITNVELRINSLKQRMLSCEQLGSEFALKKVRWRSVLPRHHSRYLFTDPEKPTIITRDSVGPTSKAKDQDHKCERDEGLPLFMYTYSTKPALAKDSGQARDSKMVPVHDRFSKPSKSPNPTFHFQTNNKLCNGPRNRKPLHVSDILSLIRRVREKHH